MATLIQYLPYDNGSFINMKTWAQGISNAFTTFGWVPSTDGGNLSGTGNYGTATITNISITSNVLTVTFSGATFNIASGQVLLLSGLTTNTFLNGQYVMVQNSGTPANDHTTTTFLAAFTHANVGSVSDTGTITAVYNWNTVTNTSDSTETGNYSLKQPKKFRGNWVGTTPTMSNLQTTNNQTTVTFATPHGLDLTHAVGQGLFIVNVANANFTWLNTNPTSPVIGIYAGWPILSVTSTTIVLNTGSSPRADIASTAVSAGTGEPVYIGSSGNSTVTPCDLVFYGGDMYENVLGTAAGIHGQANQPGTDITKWKRVLVDVWTSADALSSTNKLFLRIQYGMTTTSGDFPFIYIWGGTSSDGNTNINQNMFWGTTGPTGITQGTTPTTGGALWECDFSGSAGRFGMIMWRGYNAASTTSAALILDIERSHDNSGNDTDAYWTITWCSANTVNGQVSIFKQGTGGVGPFEFNTGTSVIKTISTAASTLSYNNSIAIQPVFPMVGYVGNPLLGVLSLRGGDTAEGAIITTTLYGTTHTFLLSKAGNSTSGGPACFGPNASSGCGLRWE